MEGRRRSFGAPRLIAPRHLHRSDGEAWYVLEGTLRVQVGELEVEAAAGSAVFVSPAHTYWNPGPVRNLLVMTSNVYHLIQEIHAMPERTPAQLRAVFLKHDSELLDGYPRPQSSDRRLKTFFLSPLAY